MTIMNTSIHLTSSASTRLDDAALATVHGGDGALLCEIGVRVEHAINKGSWKAFFEPQGPFARLPKGK
jgi:hypothetical protein